MPPSIKSHWEAVYASKTDSGLSWTQSDPQLSLSLIRESCESGSVVDVGGGTSPLAGRLLDLGYSVTVLDISSTAIRQAQERLGARAASIQWIAADIITCANLGEFDVWHDRAVFHFLTNPADRAAYIAQLHRSVPAGRHAVIATFALDGPEKCSGLEVRRYSGETLLAELGSGFELLKSVPEIHVTPWGARQSFQYSLFRRS